MKMMMNRPARTKGTKTTSRAHINLMEETMLVSYENAPTIDKGSGAIPAFI